MLDNIYSKFIMGKFLLQVSYAHALLSFFIAVKLSRYNYKPYFKAEKEDAVHNYVYDQLKI